MKFLRYTILLLLAMVLSTTLHAANKQKKVYMFGLGASFNDSTVYLTDVQCVDSAWMSKNGFLISRDNYSYELRDYLTNQGEKYRVCTVSFSPSLKKINKKYKKMLARYTNRKKGNFIVKHLKKEEFKFLPITPYEVEQVESGKKETKKPVQTSKGNGQRPPMGGHPDGQGPMGNGGPR